MIFHQGVECYKGILPLQLGPWIFYRHEPPAIIKVQWVFSQLKLTWRGIEANRCDLEATRPEFVMQLVALESQTRPGSGGNAWISADMQPPKFDGSTFWTIFNLQSRAVADHNGWEAGGGGSHTFTSHSPDLTQCPSWGDIWGYCQGGERLLTYN
jgi:hypothetical protein